MNTRPLAAAAATARSASGTVNAIGFFAASQFASPLSRRLGTLRMIAGATVGFALATGVSVAAYSFSSGVGVRAAGTVLGFQACLEIVNGLGMAAYALATQRSGLLVYARRHGAIGLLPAHACGDGPVIVKIMDQAGADGVGGEIVPGGIERQVFVLRIGG